MNLGQLLSYLNFISVKENRGETYKPDNFNINLPRAVERHYNKLIDEYERTRKISGALSAYKVVMGGKNMPLEIDGYGEAIIPSDYNYPSSFLFKYLTEVWNDGVCSTEVSYRPVEFCSDDRFNYRLGSTLELPNKKHPAVTESDGIFRFFPNDLMYVDFTYIAKSETPIFDYYINALGEIVYLPEGSNHVLGAGEVGSSGELAGTTVWSKSVEMTMPSSQHMAISQILLSDIGVNLRDVELIKYAQLMKQE